jgi:hypothetical protein
VRSAFVDNAGIIAFDDEYDLAFKVETHNHPSALEPFGGANTGVGGVVRDVLGVSARPIATTDVLCFGPQDFRYDQLPEGMLHPRAHRRGRGGRRGRLRQQDRASPRSTAPSSTTRLHGQPAGLLRLRRACCRTASTRPARSRAI